MTDLANVDVAATMFMSTGFTIAASIRLASRTCHDESHMRALSRRRAALEPGAALGSRQLGVTQP
jgi:hypothetical protein